MPSSNTKLSKVGILAPQTKWENLYFYQKSVVLHRITSEFCKRFLPSYGDRTVDQMNQAARSGKQNIVEGFAAGVTSIETNIKLLNVARASIKELQEDYLDYLSTHKLSLWDVCHPRYDSLLKFCHNHNKIEEYQQFFDKWIDSKMANCAITLCHMVDKLMGAFLEKQRIDFDELGGIRERMTATRLGRRKTQVEEIAELKEQVARLEAENARLRKALENRGG